MSSPEQLLADATRHREAQQEEQRQLTGQALYPAEDQDYEKSQPPAKEEDANSLRSLVASEALEPDHGDVKAATGNKSFDEGGGGGGTAAKQQAASAAAAAPQQQQQAESGGGDHLEPSREPSKPGSSHPVMDSSK